MTSLDTALILDGSPIPSFVIDAKHKVVHWNQALAQLTGIPAREVIGTHHQWRAFYRAHRPVMADIVPMVAPPASWKVLRRKVSRVGPGSRRLRSGGFFPALGESGRWLSFSAPLRDAEGKVVGCIETLQDITARRAAEEAGRRASDASPKSWQQQPGGHLRPRPRRPRHPLEQGLRSADRVCRQRDPRPSGRLARLLRRPRNA